MGSILFKQSTSLPEKDINFITANSTFDRSTVVSLHKEFLEVFPGGAMSEEDFIFMNEGFFPKKNLPGQEELGRLLFNIFDKDKDGFVNFREFILAIHVLSSESLDDRLRYCTAEGARDEPRNLMAGCVQTIYLFLNGRMIKSSQFPNGLMYLRS